MRTGCVHKVQQALELIGAVYARARSTHAHSPFVQLFVVARCLNLHTNTSNSPGCLVVCPLHFDDLVATVRSADEAAVLLVTERLHAALRW